jgi:NADPH-dependent F420 reductase
VTGPADPARVRPSLKGTELPKSTIAVLGGTGPQGRGLAYRFALHGHDVVIGSRDADRANEMAAEITAKAGSTGSGSTVRVSGRTNAAAAAMADVAVLAVPYAGHASLVESLVHELAHKIVVSCVNPLAFDQRGPYAVDVPDGSAAEEAARLLPGSRVTGAFHHVSALSLWRQQDLLEHEDVLVCGDDEDANDVVAQLAEAVTGRPGLICGGLRLARELEPWTAVLISINKRYKVRSGIRISGVG